MNSLIVPVHVQVTISCELRKIDRKINDFGAPQEKKVILRPIDEKTSVFSDFSVQNPKYKGKPKYKWMRAFVHCPKISGHRTGLLILPP